VTAILLSDFWVAIEFLWHTVQLFISFSQE